MQATEAKLKAFRKWLLSRGRSIGTADLYVRDVRSAYEYDDPTERLLERGISPATKRHHLAALRAWARYRDNDRLKLQLDDLRLPPPGRVTDKQPLDREDWDALLDCIEQSTDLDEPMQAVLWMIAIRGFRVSDVCRLTRPDVRQGVRTGYLTYTSKGSRRLRWRTDQFSDSLETFLSYEGWKNVWDLLSPSSSLHRRGDQARKNVYRHLKKIAKEVGIDPDEIYTHRLRRTYAVYYLEASGGNIQSLKDHMDWRSIETASKYVDHARHEELERVADQMHARRRK